MASLKAMGFFAVSTIPSSDSTVLVFAKVTFGNH